MATKTPQAERQIIVATDHRRRYGSRVNFQIRDAGDIGEIGPVSIALPTGTFATLAPTGDAQPGVASYQLQLEGFAAAADAEAAGNGAAQGLLLAAISMNFGMRLNYQTHQPASVFDRTASPGFTVNASLTSTWPQRIVIDEIEAALRKPLHDPRLVLSLELFASATLEPNDRTRFVMAVSALEPLAEQADLGPEVAAFVAKAIVDLANDRSIPDALRPSLEGRLWQLREESIRQALRRLCHRWFPGNQVAQAEVEFAYGLRSTILHEGRADADLLFAQETSRISRYLRAIYAQEFEISLRVPAMF